MGDSSPSLQVSPVETRMRSFNSTITARSPTVSLRVPTLSESNPNNVRRRHSLAPETISSARHPQVMLPGQPTSPLAINSARMVMAAPFSANISPRLLLTTNRRSFIFSHSPGNAAAFHASGANSGVLHGGQYVHNSHHLLAIDSKIEQAMVSYIRATASISLIRLCVRIWSKPT